MENKETKSEEIIEIIAINDKASSAGRKYFQIETDKGNFSCFEFDIITELKKHFGQKVEVEIAVNDRGFKNLRKFIRSIDTIKAAPVTVNKEIVEARSMKDTSIYTSYAKDILIALISKSEKLDGLKTEPLMEVAINLVNKAKESFK
ncbi:hypothetical protein M0R04_15640 [Candidatus Dojkabacteria bacterium]|jgi:hypothetical protein|nr:hypothetical protein [Candidatus Dojkabacteria bacterium]